MSDHGEWFLLLRPAFDNAARWLIVAGLSLVVLPVFLAHAETVRPGLPRHILTALPPFDPAVREAYQTAMGRYEVALEGDAAGAAGSGMLIRRPERFLWTWAGPQGRVQRVAPNVYVVGGDDCLGGFCTQIDCRNAVWPRFDCSDGRQRRMSAPDLDTMILDGITYRRLKPVSVQ